jgi:16S rRNA C967 or C1407 C5-methylase (RsmB/RsmF family)
LVSLEKIEAGERYTAVAQKEGCSMGIDAVSKRQSASRMAVVLHMLVLTVRYADRMTPGVELVSRNAELVAASLSQTFALAQTSVLDHHAALPSLVLPLVPSQAVLDSLSAPPAQTHAINQHNHKHNSQLVSHPSQFVHSSVSSPLAQPSLPHAKLSSPHPVASLHTPHPL